MARIEYPQIESLPAETQEALRKIRSINVFKLAAWADSLAPSFFAFVTDIFAKTALDPKLRQIAILRVGHLCNSRYELHQHEKLARIVGLSEEEIGAVADGRNLSALDERCRAIAAFADEMTNEIRVSDATFDRVRAFLSEKQLTELALITGFYSAICRFLETMDVEIEPPRKRGPAS